MILTKAVLESRTQTQHRKAIVSKDDRVTGFDVALYIEGEHVHTDLVPTLAEAVEQAKAHVNDMYFQEAF